MCRLLDASIASLVVLSLVSAGCNDAGFSGGGTAQKQVVAEVKPGAPTVTEELEVKINKADGSNGKADIIFLLDTSDSMKDEKAKLEKNMAAFVEELTGAYRVIDFQIVMIGQDFIFPEGNAAKEEIVIHQVASHDALSVLQGFLVNPGLNKIHLRPDAVKEFVIVSDDNASMNPRDFEAWAQANARVTGKIRINGIVGTDESRQNSVCQIAAPGTTYKRLEESPVVGGLVQDICSADWGPLLAGLARNIMMNNSKTEFVLSKPIREGSQIHIVINGKPIDPAHLSTDYGRNAIVLDGSVLTKPGDKVMVTYAVR